MWEDNIKVDIKGRGVDRRNWVISAHDRNFRRALVNAALNLRYYAVDNYVFLIKSKQT